MKNNKLKILLSYSRPHFDPEKSPSEQKLWGSSANVLARSLYEILSKIGEVTYIDPPEYESVAGRTFDLFVGQARNFKDILDVCEVKRSIYFAVNMHPAERNNIVHDFMARNNLPSQEVLHDELADSAAMSASLTATDHIICVGNTVGYNSYVRQGVPKTKIRLINYAVGPAKSSGSKPAKDGLRRYVYVATELGLRKGFDIVEALLQQLESQGGKFHLDIIGEPKLAYYRNKLESIQKQYSGQVTYHGWIDVTAKAYQEILGVADFVLFPSLEEGQAGTILDAIRLGVVPLVSQNSGIDHSPLGFLELSVKSEVNKLILGQAQSLSDGELSKLKAATIAYYQEYHSTFEGQLERALTDAVAGDYYPLLSITLAIFNKEETILELLQRLDRAARVYGNVELHIIFDGCKDRSEEITRLFYKERTAYPVYYEVTPNIFEVKTNNIGLKNSAGRYCVIVQDDNYLNDPNCFLEAVIFLEKDSTAVVLGGLAGVNFYPRGTTALSGPGQITISPNEVYWRQDEQTNPAFKHRIFEVDACMRGPLFIRKSFLEDHGYLDEIYVPLYQDDMDLCFRARKYGYKVYAILMNVENRSQTVASYNPERARFWEKTIKRNTDTFYRRWTPSVEKNYSWISRVPLVSSSDKSSLASAKHRINENMNALKTTLRTSKPARALDKLGSFIANGNRMGKLRRRLKLAPTQPFGKTSYAQSGEDLIVRLIFDGLGIEKPSYIDLGAHHPEYLSNTKIFYDAGSRGINVEPDPLLFQAFREHRPGDINLNIGVASQATDLPFYKVDPPTLNTFSKTEAEKYKQEGHEITGVEKIPVSPLKDILKVHNGGKMPDFLSLDVEGVDFEILKSIDYKEAAPLVICCETISYARNGRGVKDPKIQHLLEAKGYLLYADTNINTIFVLKDVWMR